ncbi:aminotransferase [Prevotella pallens]|jgi:hypothetical protein|uniref:aminotransferase n=1 Tax=Prevotella pallens TaxID=60133 RepID=UPI0023F3C765|nr:aminotransferase [Prevotella pallens]
MKSNVTTPKMAYLQPVCTCVNVQAESHILTISATTTNPVEGGDPTGGSGNGNTPNPFGNSAAQSKTQQNFLDMQEEY